MVADTGERTHLARGRPPRVDELLFRRKPGPVVTGPGCPSWGSVLAVGSVVGRPVRDRGQATDRTGVRRLQAGAERTVLCRGLGDLLGDPAALDRRDRRARH